LIYIIFGRKINWQEIGPQFWSKPISVIWVGIFMKIMSRKFDEIFRPSQIALKFYEISLEKKFVQTLISNFRFKLWVQILSANFEFKFLLQIWVQILGSHFEFKNIVIYGKQLDTNFCLKFWFLLKIRILATNFAHNYVLQKRILLSTYLANFVE